MAEQSHTSPEMVTLLVLAVACLIMKCTVVAKLDIISIVN